MAKVIPNFKFLKKAAQLLIENPERAEEIIDYVSAEGGIRHLFFLIILLCPEDSADGVVRAILPQRIYRDFL